MERHHEPRPEARPKPTAEPVYDVLLACPSPESLRSRFPRMAVQTIGAQTALRRRVGAPAQLDALLDEVLALGLSLLDVHRLPGPPGAEQTYEVRLAGEIGEPLLRRLSWPHRAVPAQTRVRITASTDELPEVLRDCTESGATIQRVRRVEGDRAVARGCAGPVSRDRVVGPGVRRRPAG